MKLSRVAVIRPFSERIALPATYERYRQIDQASYEHAPIDPPPALVALAAQLTERTLHPVKSRVIRMLPGDYLLAHHDELHDDHRVEITLDVSPAPVANAEVRYQRAGNVFFIVPSAPATAAIVERDSATQAYHTYVSKLHTGAIVQRLVIQLVDS